jgi:16S rRNA (cytosine1407-C5)-methyltransferase
MASITETKNRLPKEFVDNLYTMFTPGVVDNIFKGIMEKRYTTLRVNTLKYDIQELMQFFKELNIKFERVLWYKDALVIKNANEKDIQKLDIYQKGYIYLQSLPSMVPPLVLNPKPGERVLDLTAAPGSKTTEIACLMNNKGYILANELDKLRCERLKYNVEAQDADIVEVVCGRGEKIGELHKEEFDKVLLDTPCSGEGRFSIYNIQTYKTWSTKTVSELVKTQKKLFKSAYEALKPGGTLVYSTCTLNKEENEYILDWSIKEFNLKLVDINIELKDALPAFNEGLEKSINKAIRILPSKNMEGFFVSKLIKGE